MRRSDSQILISVCVLVAVVHAKTLYLEPIFFPMNTTFIYLFIYYYYYFFFFGGVGGGVQGWRSGESTRLTPMWLGLDPQTRRHMWVEFVGSLL